MCPMSDLTEGAVRGGLYAQCLTLQRGSVRPMSDLTEGAVRRGSVRPMSDLTKGVCTPNV